MPEGPEVRIITEGLQKYLTNSKIIDINIIEGRYYPEERNPEYFKEFKNNLPLSITDIKCKGKLIYFILENNWYILNTLGMSGRWTTEKIKHSHIEIKYITDNQEKIIWYCDPRRFGTFKLLMGEKELTKKLKSLGPDILNDTTITTQQFIDIMRKHNSKNITKVLMNQSIICGCGNYLKSETLYRCKLSPHHNVIDLTDIQLENIFNTLKDLIQLSYQSQGASLSTYYDIEGQKGGFTFEFQVYGKKQDILGNTITTETTPDGRTTYWVKELQL